MPNSFTHPVYSGEEITALELAQRFARNFIMHQRDEPLEEPPRGRGRDSLISMEMNLTGYYDLRADIIAMSEEELQAHQDNDRLHLEIKKSELIAKNSSIAARYDHAISVFTAWAPSTPAGKRVKETALKMLQESKEFDVHDNPAKYIEIPEHVSPEEYRNQLLQEVELDIEQCEEKVEKESARIEESRAWVADFNKDADLLSDIKLNV